MDKGRALIHEYQQTVEKVVSGLRTFCGTTDLLAARRSGRIPKEGRAGDIEYSFHGLGCRATLNNTEVDFDFGPGGRTDGFDAWRLWLYAKQFGESYAGLQELEDVESVVDALLRTGDITRLATPPTPHLCYWSDSAPTRASGNH